MVCISPPPVSHIKMTGGGGVLALSGFLQEVREQNTNPLLKRIFYPKACFGPMKTLYWIDNRVWMSHLPASHNQELFPIFSPNPISHFRDSYSKRGSAAALWTKGLQGWGSGLWKVWIRIQSEYSDSNTLNFKVKVEVYHVRFGSSQIFCLWSDLNPYTDFSWGSDSDP